MQTLAIISHKGGAGKTSTSVMLAEELARRGQRTVLVDADRQRGAGLLLGIEQPGTSAQQTRVLRLQYFCSSGLPLRDLPARAEELRREFDVAVVDTPSLDDPLAKSWLALATHVLLVLPVEPLSIRTIESADQALANIRAMNPGVQVVGTLPTMFDERDTTQRSLMSELRSLRGDTLLSPPIPHDPGLAHRAEQKSERRTEASAATQQAYQAVGETLVRALGLQGKSAAGPSAWSARAAKPAAPPAPRAPAAPSPPSSSAVNAAPEAKAVSGGGRSRPAWLLPVIGVALLVLIAVGVFLATRGRGALAAPAEGSVREYRWSAGPYGPRGGSA